MTESVLIRKEMKQDAAKVKSLLQDCFPNEPVAELVEALRDRQQTVFTLVASLKSDPESVVGYIAFSAMKSPPRTLGLAPLGVHRGYRGQGIANMLITRGIQQAKEQGHAAIVVVGSLSLYGRFGFNHAAVSNLGSSYAKEHVLGVELQGDYLRSQKGELAFADEFAELGL